MTEFDDFLKDLCGQFEDENIELHGTDKFREIAIWDSLTGMAVLYMIESKYDVVISPEELKGMETPMDIYAYISKRKLS
jgi:acyl carrier protein